MPLDHLAQNRRPVMLRSIQIGKSTRYHLKPSRPEGETEWFSAINKAPVNGSIRLCRKGLEGDDQADKENHGGLDKAILAYSAAHYEAWKRELPVTSLPFGAFGENFTVEGLTEDHVCIGDTFQIGSVVVQVSQPRVPCWKLSQRWNLPELTKQVAVSGRTGWYLRVLEEGFVEAGTQMELAERKFQEWTVLRASKVMRSRQTHPSEAHELAKCELLSQSWREKLRSTREPED
ncbi:MAG: MOSC domain-containing protein [Acidobacteriia bacterium]|nr:MOSC domain-containing protein [Terriglobia bacterium]